MNRKRSISATKKLETEVERIWKEVRDFAPPRGSDPRSVGPIQGGGTTKKFGLLPISSATKDALKDSGYVDMTEIQRACIPHALCGRDVLGAAKTGSGKTLAFLIPVLECLFRHRWSTGDGVGALIITPTRELAIQIFEVLARIGKNHSFSAALLIGGKNVHQEQERINSMNILVCTPGRLLQHMDETPSFHCDNLLMLVLDEADRCLDMGFQRSLDAIVQNLPKERQTLLFSATQTKRVDDLVRLSLRDSEYISIHSESSVATPSNLQQTYITCPLEQKVNMLWSFLRTHLTHKIVVFVASCKQAKFLHEAFRKLRPGLPLRSLHGKMKQQKRLIVFTEFCRAKCMAIFATDVAARGLDFPAVDWVVQLDCPDSVATYIHRVGRTARYTSKGKALMLLLPSENAFLNKLSDSRVPLRKLAVNPLKQQDITSALQALLSKVPEIKSDAQRALVSYVKSVYLSPDKEVFDVRALPISDFSDSLGLPNPPKLQFLKGKQYAAQVGQALVGNRHFSDRRSGKDTSWTQEVLHQPTTGTGRTTKTVQHGNEAECQTKLACTREGSVSAAQGNAKASLFSHPEEEEDAGESFFVLRERHETQSDSIQPNYAEETLPKSKRKRTKISRNKRAGNGTRVLFDADGNPIHPLAALGVSINDDDKHDPGRYFETARQFIVERNVKDRQELKERIAKVRQARKSKQVEAEEYNSDASLPEMEQDQATTAMPFTSPRPEVAHQGMLPASSADIDSYSLEQKEALALHLLR